MPRAVEASPTRLAQDAFDPARRDTVQPLDDRRTLYDLRARAEPGLPLFEDAR
ncbi:hypothetical protein [Streptomyces sp. TP-A0356]|uniref:hypothetical protein n=1 Tax=Streptomyces sp. TP-A0356 TaxID=1359208 RepID=UPI000A95BEC3|nr:hypothetical protein [Streptomyces sp. TP-A0356]